jgi:hypothetical protein
VFTNDEDIDILDVIAQLLVIGYVDPVTNDVTPNPDAAPDAEIKVDDIKLEVLEIQSAYSSKCPTTGYWVKNPLNN